MTSRHRDAAAFRASLDERIRNASQETGTSHDRLRKNIAFHRLVARFVAVDDDRWAIKGGVALLWRVSLDARATRNVDTNWSGTRQEFETFLDRAVSIDTHDWFDFEISAPRPLTGETEGGWRFGDIARLDGREFAAFRLDANLVIDSRPVERVPIHLQVARRPRRSHDRGSAAARRETSRGGTDLCER